MEVSKFSDLKEGILQDYGGKGLSGLLRREQFFVSFLDVATALSRISFHLIKLPV